MDLWILKVLVLVAGVLALGFVGYLIAIILRESEGTDRMKPVRADRETTTDSGSTIAGRR